MFQIGGVSKRYKIRRYKIQDRNREFSYGFPIILYLVSCIFVSPPPTRNLKLNILKSESFEFVNFHKKGQKNIPNILHSDSK